LLLVAIAVASSATFAQAPLRPRPYCVRNVSVESAGGPDRTVTLVLREGRIEAVLDGDAPAPPGTRVVDGEGLLVLPGFLDAFSTTGCETPTPLVDRDVPLDTGADVRADMRTANRKGVQPSFRAVDALAISGDQANAWRKAGFGAALVAPGGQLLAGSSALATTREAAMRDVVLRPVVFGHAAFQASGSGYPSTLMGYFAQLRQLFHDAAWHAERLARYEQGRPGLRPPFDAELDAGAELLAGERKLVCEAETHRDIERWIRLADELGLEDIAISGGREAWRVAEVLAARDVVVLLTLDWSDEVEDPRPKEDEDEAEESSEEPPEERWEYQTPLAVRVDQRLRWEEERDCAIRLHEAGVRFAFGTGDAKPDKLLGKVRDLVEEGLPRETAEAALTTGAARILGVERRLGRIEPGYDATFVLWTADPLTEKKAKPAWVFVDGYPTEYEVAETDDISADETGELANVTGTWVVEQTSEEQMGGTTRLVLVMAEDGDLSGTIHTRGPSGDERATELSGRVRGNGLEFEAAFETQGISVEITGSARVDGDTMEGEVSLKVPFSEEPMVQEIRAVRKPGAERSDHLCLESEGR